jgi:hypothetical protein
VNLVDVNEKSVFCRLWCSDLSWLELLFSVFLCRFSLAVLTSKGSRCPLLGFCFSSIVGVCPQDLPCPPRKGLSFQSFSLPVIASTR